MSACWISLFRSGWAAAASAAWRAPSFWRLSYFLAVVFFAGAACLGALLGAVAVFLGGVFEVWGVAGIATPQTRSNEERITLLGNGKSSPRLLPRQSASRENGLPGWRPASCAESACRTQRPKCHTHAWLQRSLNALKVSHRSHRLPVDLRNDVVGLKADVVGKGSRVHAGHQYAALFGESGIFYVSRFQVPDIDSEHRFRTLSAGGPTRAGPGDERILGIDLGPVADRNGKVGPLAVPDNPRVAFVPT